ncbi:MAG: MW1434 family type I TA system toxin [Bilophila wadsworthia]
MSSANPDSPKNRVPWLASQADMLAEDWEVANV